MCNRSECSLNISEDKFGYEEDTPKRVSKCYGCQNVPTESSKEYPEKITVKKKQASRPSFFTEFKKSL